MGLAQFELLKHVVPTGNNNDYLEEALPLELEQKLTGVWPICAVHLGSSVPLVGLNLLWTWGRSVHPEYRLQ